MRIECAVRPGIPDGRSAAVTRELRKLEPSVRVVVVDVYLIDGRFDAARAADLLGDSVANDVVVDGRVRDRAHSEWTHAVEITVKPGVTDPVAQTVDSVLAPIADFVPIRAQTARQIVFHAPTLSTSKISALSKELYNPLIQHATLIERIQGDVNSRGAGSSGGDRRSTAPNADAPPAGFPDEYPRAGSPEIPVVESFALESMDDDALETLNRERLLALNAAELAAIRDYYARTEVRAEREKRGLTGATDVELEMFAQTWSEHCKHKIFAASIDVDGRVTVDSLFAESIAAVTRELSAGRDDLLSVFDDNSGVVRFDDEYAVCFKAETHNSPSALDPYGGAITGIVGVNRDILGTGRGARPIFNTNVLCFADPDCPQRAVPGTLLPPERVLDGVHAGIVDGGNQSGIPVVAGAFLFDDSYLGKPLVFCGTGGIVPNEVAGAPGWEKRALPGDAAVMVGGRIGKDGIHGATFSSLALDESSPTSAVQIGDPITQKKMTEFLLEARDAGLIRSLTDNGAGGLSSSLGEMARESGGVEVDLDRCPLKYDGLAAWEIWVSESQERMSAAVAPEHLERFLELAGEHDVEATAIGRFTGSGAVELVHRGRTVCYVDLEMLHGGLPRMRLRASWIAPEARGPRPAEHPAVRRGDDRASPPAGEHTAGRASRGSPQPRTGDDVSGGTGRTAAGRAPADAGHSPAARRYADTPHTPADRLLALLRDPNIASKEALVRRYDHEVQAGTAGKPFVGRAADGPSDGGIVTPRPDSPRALTVTHGVCPRYGDWDTYRMAVCAIDEAYRAHIALGGNPARAWALDNFCWPDPVESERTPDGAYKLAQLVRACRGLADACLSYDLPLISGKDSMKNDARIGERTISVRPTLLISLMGIVDDIERSLSSDFRAAGDAIYLVGQTRGELGGTAFDRLFGPLWEPSPLPDLAVTRRCYEALAGGIERGLLASAHDLSDGGLAVALAEAALGGRLGCSVSLDAIALEPVLDTPAVDGARGERNPRFTAGLRTESAGAGAAGGAGKPTSRHTEGTGNAAQDITITDTILFCESAGRILVSVAPEHVNSFEAQMHGLPCVRLGSVDAASSLEIDHEGSVIVSSDLEPVVDAWHSFDRRFENGGIG